MFTKIKELQTETLMRTVRTTMVELKSLIINFFIATCNLWNCKDDFRNKNSLKIENSRYKVLMKDVKPVIEENEEFESWFFVKIDGIFSHFGSSSRSLMQGTKP